MQTADGLLSSDSLEARVEAFVDQEPSIWFSDPHPTLEGVYLEAAESVVGGPLTDTDVVRLSGYFGSDYPEHVTITLTQQNKPPVDTEIWVWPSPTKTIPLE